MVADAGFDMNHYHFESFGGEIMGEIAVDSAVKTVRVSLEKSGQSAVVDPDELLIDTLEGQQAPIVAACRAGVCGACKVQITDGEVQSSSQMTLTPQEIEQGYVLSCCSKPQSDITVNI